MLAEGLRNRSIMALHRSDFCSRKVYIAPALSLDSHYLIDTSTDEAVIEYAGERELVVAGPKLAIWRSRPNAPERGMNGTAITVANINRRKILNCIHSYQFDVQSNALTTIALLATNFFLGFQRLFSQQYYMSTSEASFRKTIRVCKRLLLF